MEEPPPLLRLPNEVLLHVLEYLPHRSLFQASHTCRRLYDASFARPLHTPHLRFLKDRIQTSVVEARELRFKFYKGVSTINSKPPKEGMFNRITVYINVKRDPETDLLHYQSIRMVEGARKVNSRRSSGQAQSGTGEASEASETSGTPEAPQVQRAREEELEQKWLKEWLPKIIGAFNLDFGDLEEWEVKLEESQVDAAKLLRLFGPPLDRVESAADV